MRRRSHLLAGVALAACLGTAASAGPYEDGAAALGKKDYATAQRSFGEAAAKGDARAQAYLGIMYQFGLGVTADPKQALQWLSLAADGGSAEGEAALGDMYVIGKAVPRDYAQALKYLTLAAKQNFPHAQYGIGRLYYYGADTVVTKDYAKAAGWYQLAAKNGDADAQFNLAYMYFYGIGIAKNFETAVALLKLAVQQDDKASEALLGYAYDNGYGVPQDYALAARYYKRAAQRGSINALGLLGEMYAGGKGMPQDWSKAYLLLSLSAAHTEGDTQQAMTKERDAAKSHLNADQLAKAQATASECEQSDYASCPIDENRRPTERTADGHTIQLFATGSGFYVSKAGYLITNNHVVRQCSEVRQGKRVLKVVNVDEKADLALLLDPKKPATIATLRGGKGPRLGESIVAVGYPLTELLGEKPVVTTGVVSTLETIENDGKMMQISAPIQPGNSGGPVLGEDGTVVGVVVAAMNSLELAALLGEVPQNVNFAVSLTALRSLLKINKIAVGATDTGAHKSTADISTDAAGYTVLLECWK